MKKLLFLYMLLLFTACTENGSLHHRRRPIQQTSVMCAETEEHAVADPGLVISVIVNREIALYETSRNSTIKPTEN
ncbi:hypothetical protein [Prolixibacter bellariivorans]|uniref:hypothetical protein n=1 Tax=Prolixibacter bellariivorans TaxID=314319 RepID=UPI001298F236|nr:hypothetical protein [Prolixibacter bellariivorans]